MSTWESLAGHRRMSEGVGGKFLSSLLSYAIYAYTSRERSVTVEKP